jgi:hypothetical protein
MSLRVSGSKGDEITVAWRALHNEKPNDLHSSPNIIGVIKSRRMRWVGHVARMGERRGKYIDLLGKPEGKRPLGRPKLDLRIILRWQWFGDINWVNLAHDRDRWRALVNEAMYYRVSLNVGNFLTS